MAVEANAEQVLPLPLGCASASSPPTVGDLLTRRASAAVTNRECSSPRSLLSRILHRRRNSGFGCRLRLLPRYCSSGAAKDDAIAITVKEELAAPKVVGSRAEPPRESPRRSLAEKKAPSTADDALPASLGLGASLVLLLSKSAAELSRMAELRAQMERMMMDVRADVGSCNGRPSASDGHTRTDSTSVVKEPIACADGNEEEKGAMLQCPGGSENDERSETMDQMEAELVAELSRLQVASNNDEDTMTPRQDRQVEAEAKSAGATSGDHSVICTDSDIDNGATEQDGDEGQDDDDEDDEEEDGDEESPGHGGVSARELERRLHELLQSRHEERMAELESALERARRKLKEKEREASRWRDTAKLAARFTDDSRLR